jgi:hypothetical protein
MGVEVLIHIFLTSALASHSGRLTPREGAPVDPSVSLNDVEKRIFFILPGLELQSLGRPDCSQSLYRLLPQLR